MEVIDTPFRGGDLRHGYQAVADNLPNDARIHEQKGTKKLFFKNYMDARVNDVILPLAKRIMDEQQAAQGELKSGTCEALLGSQCNVPTGTITRRPASADGEPARVSRAACSSANSSGRSTLPNEIAS